MVGVEPYSCRKIRTYDQVPVRRELKPEAAVEDVIGVIDAKQLADEAEGSGQLTKVHATIVYTNTAEL